MINNKFIYTNQRGYSLVEMAVYIALLGIITIVIVGVFSMITRTNSRVMSLMEINSNAYSAMERIVYEVVNSNNIYFPSSNFANYNYDGAKAMQFSVASRQDVLLNENIRYVDFYLENNTIFMKQDGAPPVALTSENVSVENLSFYYYLNDNRESVRVDFTVKSNNILNSESKIDLSTVIALRS